MTGILETIGYGLAAVLGLVGEYLWVNRIIAAAAVAIGGYLVYRNTGHPAALIAAGAGAVCAVAFWAVA